MLYLREYRPKADRLFDHLPWVALIGPGLVLNKDGSFQKTVAFRGPDLASSTDASLVATRAQLNNALRRLGSRWCLHIEALRAASQDYPASQFPDLVSDLVVYPSVPPFTGVFCASAAVGVAAASKAVAASVCKSSFFMEAGEVVGLKEGSCLQA